jgi:hypothetical protein
MKFPPKGVWIGVSLAALAGVGTLFGSKYVHTERFHLPELLRDIGIGFIVSAVVSLIYEWNTRSVAHKENLVNLYNNLMSTNVPEEVWDEVNNEIFHWPVRRSSIAIKLKIKQQWPYVGRPGKKVLPRHKAVLEMEYGYDLYRLRAGRSKFEVTHDLDYFVDKDEEINAPRFESVVILRGDNGATLKEYDGLALTQLCDAEGNLKLAGEDAIELPPTKKKQHVRIITRRVELVNTPGVYVVIMPELVIGSIHVCIEELPPDLKAEVITMAYINFKQAPNQNVWDFEGVMLPGQLFGIGFRRTRG